MVNIISIKIIPHIKVTIFFKCEKQTTYIEHVLLKLNYMFVFVWKYILTFSHTNIYVIFF